MVQPLRITLLSNAGLLLEYGGTTLLLDAIYNAEDNPFSVLPDTLWQELLAGRPPFDRIDYLLFTHDHPDHMDCAMVRQYLARRPVKGVFLPDVANVRESGLLDDLVARGIPAVPLSRQTDHASYRVEPEVTVQAFQTLHIDRQFRDVAHFCYLLTFGQKRILFTADMDYLTEDLSRLGPEPLAAIFVNPLFFTALRTERFFKGRLHTGHVCVYHIPFPADDVTGMRARLDYDLAHWPVGKPPVMTLTKSLQQIIL